MFGELCIWGYNIMFYYWDELIKIKEVISLDRWYYIGQVKGFLDLVLLINIGYLICKQVVFIWYL